MHETPPIRVLIVDDHPIVRVGIVAIVQAQTGMEVVAQGGSVVEAVRLFQEHRPDLTVMDLRLPDGSGVEAIRRLRAFAPDAKVIVLTTYDGDEDIHQALAAGARGYLIKGMPHDVLIRALKRVHAGQRYLPATVTETLSSRIPGSSLSQRELEVLQLMFGGCSNREIADELGIKEATVKSHVSVILMRLGVADRTQAVVEALKRGMIHL